eukprot:700269-Prymnesium_polylepis.2
MLAAGAPALAGLEVDVAGDGGGARSLRMVPRADVAAFALAHVALVEIAAPRLAALEADVVRRGGTARPLAERAFAALAEGAVRHVCAPVLAGRDREVRVVVRRAESAEEGERK